MVHFPQVFLPIIGMSHLITWCPKKLYGSYLIINIPVYQLVSKLFPPCHTGPHEYSSTMMIFRPTTIKQSIYWSLLNSITVITDLIESWLSSDKKSIFRGSCAGKFPFLGGGSCRCTLYHFLQSHHPLELHCLYRHYKNITDLSSLVISSSFTSSMARKHKWPVNPANICSALDN